MMRIDARSSTPLYKQIQQNIKELILSGTIKSFNKCLSFVERRN